MKVSIIKILPFILLPFIAKKSNGIFFIVIIELYGIKNKNSSRLYGLLAHDIKYETKDWIIIN
jgi:hypothetical protein